MGGVVILCPLQVVWKISLDAVMHFAIFLIQPGIITSATINSKMAVLSFAPKADGFPDPGSDFSIRRALQDQVKAQPRLSEIVCASVSYISVIPFSCFWLQFAEPA